MPISPMFATPSSFTRPIRMPNRIRLENRIKEIGCTRQPERTFCAFHEVSKTIAVVPGNHRKFALMNLDQCLLTYVMKVDLKKEDITLSQIAFTVKQFFKGTQTDPDLYDYVLQLQKWMNDTAKKSVQKARQLRMTNYVFKKTRCLLEHKLDKSKSVRELLRSAEGSHRASDSLLLADVIGAVLKGKTAMKALVIVAYKGANASHTAECELNI